MRGMPHVIVKTMIMLYENMAEFYYGASFLSYTQLIFSGYS